MPSAPWCLSLTSFPVTVVPLYTSKPVPGVTAGGIGVKVGEGGRGRISLLVGENLVPRSLSP